MSIMECKALNRHGKPCKSKTYESGLCKPHLRRYIQKSSKLHLINPELPIIVKHVQCSAITLKGSQCKMIVPEDHAYCKIHISKKPKPKRLKPKDYKKYIASSKWAKKSKSVRAEYDDRCRLCNRKGLIHAHHRTYERLGEELPEDLTPLCKDCHDLFGENYAYDKKTHTFKPNK